MRVTRLDSRLKAIGLDETAAKRGQTYVTVFIDLDAKDKPVVFVTPGRGKETVARFEAFLAEHGGRPSRIAEVVCDMSGAFLAAVGETFEDAAVTVDWFHVVQMFTKAVDDVRRAEAKHGKLPKSLRWAILKRADGRLTNAQADALRTRNIEPADRRRLAHQGDAPLDPQSRGEPGRSPAHHPLPASRQATPQRRPHPRSRPEGGWPPSKSTSSASSGAAPRHTAMPASEGLNGLFQAARARTSGYRNTTTLATMIYLIVGPLGDLLQSP